MSDPFEFLRQRAQAEQTQAAMVAAATATKSIFDAFTEAGFSREMAERLTLAWFDIAVRNAPSAAK